jgi:AcrR family transcriptional regulator
MFIEEGYTKSSINRLSKNLQLSPGHITFYFPTKEHLLAVLVEEMLEYQRIMMEQETQEGKSSLLAYCLELTAIAAVCEESEIARDFYASAYASALTLARIRANDAEKTRKIFVPFHPDWTEREWTATENIVSGIEYATIMTRETETPLETQIEKTLDTILYLFGVPEETRKTKIEKVLSMDYRALGHRLLLGFPEYVVKVNEEGLKKKK